MENNMIRINGGMGEGGGQVLRTALALSLVTGKPFRIDGIRAGRKKPGLLRQHLTAARAAATISDATIEGDAIGASTLTFQPGSVRGGDYAFAVGTAGSATLVLQTVLPALMLAGEPSHVTFEGGTHNPWAPPFDFLDRAFLPLLRRMGVAVTAQLLRHGFYPAGGGKFSLAVTPAERLARLDLLERGKVRAKKARALVACLPEKIAQREADWIQKKLTLDRKAVSVETVSSAGPGNIVMIEIASEHVTELITGFGRQGVSAERVAREVVNKARQYLASDVPVGPYLADQLLIPMALAGGGSFRTGLLTNHTTTNMAVIQAFLDVAIDTQEIDGQIRQVTVQAT